MISGMWIILSPPKKSTLLERISSRTSDIPYCDTRDKGQTLDIYRPSLLPEKMETPVIVYVHGGGWRRGDKNNTLLRAYAPLFVSHGASVVSINYRLNPPSPYPDQNIDIACAMSFLDNNAKKYDLNLKRMIFFGDSAGAQLTAFAALNIPFHGYDYEAPVGVLNFYGVSNFTTIVDGKKPDLNARRYLGSKYNKVASAASPTSYITKKAPQFLFVHGTKDTVVPISQSTNFYDQLTRAGINADYVEITGAHHGFVGPELSADRYQSLQNAIATFLHESINI